MEQRREWSRGGGEQRWRWGGGAREDVRREVEKEWRRGGLEEKCGGVEEKSGGRWEVWFTPWGGIEVNFRDQGRCGVGVNDDGGDEEDLRRCSTGLNDIWCCGERWRWSSVEVPRLRGGAGGACDVGDMDERGMKLESAEVGVSIGAGGHGVGLDVTEVG